MSVDEYIMFGVSVVDGQTECQSWMGGWSE